MEMLNTQEIFDHVASLPVEERASFADELLKTLNQPVPEVERKWVEAATRRLDELRSGRVAGIPVDEVLEKARKRLEQ